MPKKLSVGIIGCGSIARHRHAPEYSGQPDVEIVAFFDRVPARAEECAKKFGGKAFANLEDLLALPQIDAVSVCTSNETHSPYTIQALQAGKHVLCEKPMATSDEEAAAMIAASEKSGKWLMVGHNQRLAGLHVKAKSLLTAGVIGDVITFKTSFAHPGPEGWSIEGKSGWFFNKQQAFVGSMGDLGVHKADLLLWLLGQDIVEVSAFVEQIAKPYGNVDDNAVCILRARSGAIGSLTASWTHDPGEDNSTVLYGSKGIMLIGSDPVNQVIVRLASGENQLYQVGKMQSNEEGGQFESGVIREFVAAVKANKKPEISGEEGRKALAVILACLESARSGRHVKVKYA